MSIASINGPGGDDDANLPPLMRILMADEIVPGSEPDYSLCKDIFIAHPLGAKMAEAPIVMAQSQPRNITVQGAPDEVQKEFLNVWENLRCDANILNLRRLSRVYGVASLVLGCEGKNTEEPLDMRAIWNAPIYFNVFDPLNMSGSIIANQVPNTPDFNQVTRVIAAGKVYHRSRYQVVTCGDPIYLAYTDSGFGFTGRSVYQRALYALKTFIKTMIADDMIATKNGLLVAKIQSPGAVPNKLMAAIANIKRLLLKSAHTGQVVSIDPKEDIATLNMQGVDTAGTFARDNSIKNAATAADMPAKLLQNETMVGGMAEGTEDAKIISKYIDGVRVEMKPNYDWCDNLVRYRAWMNPGFYKRIQALYPEEYGSKSHDEAFSEWCRAYSATWPSMLVESDSEAAKFEEVKLEATVAAVNTFMPFLDPSSKAMMLQWAADSFGENDKLFPHKIELDWESLAEHLQEEDDRAQEMHESSMQSSEGGGKFPGFKDSTARRADAKQQLLKLRQMVDSLPARKKLAAV